jgi:hypothetical protein
VIQGQSAQVRRAILGREASQDRQDRKANAV